MARTGRPRGFDKDEVLERAMHLLWEHGYEATLLAQLKAAMGDLSASSFFGPHRCLQHVQHASALSPPTAPFGVSGPG